MYLKVRIWKLLLCSHCKFQILSELLGPNLYALLAILPSYFGELWFSVTPDVVSQEQESVWREEEPLEGI